MAFLALCRVLLGYYALLYKRKEEDYGCKENRRFSKKLRQEKKVTQEQLTEIIGVSGRMISRWETGICLPDVLF
mgnify:FL=1